MLCCAGQSALAADTWKEEVLLHDGQKMVVERSQTYGGRSEPGKSGPIGEHSIRFTVPGASRFITWTSEYGEDIGRTNFNLLAVHVKDGEPYIVVEPNLCLSYNKWGRPNPPYVFFKLEGEVWQRIPLEQFPAEFKTINVALSIRGAELKSMLRVNLVPADTIKEMNAHREQPEYKTILREPVSGGVGLTSCEELIHYKCGWGAPGEFNRKYFENSCK
jgi:hypothetical protein